MDNITSNFWEVLLWSFWLFVAMGVLVVWVLVFVDMFTNDTLGGWAKAGWAVVLIFLPLLGVLIYLVVRDVSMRRLSRSYRDA
jgi:Phospholipase_D-nuclease N-terminal